MNHQVKSLIRATLGAAALMSAQAATPGEASKPADPLDACNVVWTTASENAHGSMPLGNGDVGINTWVEANGDLVFYFSKRNSRINVGWGQDSIQAACPGLREEASRLVAIRARINQAYRFPAMWSGFDWIPDQNHGDQVKELLSNYGPIGLIWFDVPVMMTAQRSKLFADLVHSIQPATLINSHDPASRCGRFQDKRVRQRLAGGVDLGFQLCDLLVEPRQFLLAGSLKGRRLGPVRRSV